MTTRALADADAGPSIATIRRFLTVEAAAFAAASLVHAGLLVPGYQHREARIAETVIAGVLALGLLASWLRPAATRLAGMTTQGFALLGTLVGIFTIAVGVGPRTAIDVVYHAAIVLVLIAGIVAVRQSWPSDSQP